MTAEMKWQFLDQQLFSKAEVLELTGLPRGAVEGYISRGVFEPQYPQPRGGDRERQTYTGRDTLKVDAVGALVRAGVGPKNLKWMVEKNGPLDLHINNFQLDFENAKRDPRSPIIFAGPGVIEGVYTQVDRAERMVASMREAGTYAYALFDYKGFILNNVPRLEAYLKKRDG